MDHYAGDDCRDHIPGRRIHCSDYWRKERMVGMNTVLEGILVVNIFSLICLLGILIILAARADRKGKDDNNE